MTTEVLRAGSVTVTLTDAGDLRYIRVGDTEIVRRVYAAVRASDWFTVPATLTVREKTVAADSFRVVYDAVYADAKRAIEYAAILTITGDANGTITYAFDGTALSEFERRRIGICVLHPADAKGVPVIITHTNGDTETGAFPDTISPHQPFKDITAIQHTITPGIEADVAFTGDVFEMEDQRNWLDASFKTYSTPLALPAPVRLAVGDTVHQSVTITTRVAADVATQVEQLQAERLMVPPVLVTVAASGVASVPPVGNVLSLPENAVGVQGNFTELNRARPKPPFDAVYFAGNPQVHASDDLSIMETPATIAEAIRTARTFADGKPVYVGVLTFAGGDNPDDPRKDAPIGRAWYAAAVYTAINAGATGVAVDKPDGLLTPLEDAVVHPVAVSDLLRVAACAIVGTDDEGTKTVVHMANLTNTTQTVRFAGISGTSVKWLKPYEVAVIVVPEGNR